MQVTEVVMEAVVPSARIPQTLMQVVAHEVGTLVLVWENCRVDPRVKVADGFVLFFGVYHA